MSKRARIIVLVAIAILVASVASRFTTADSNAEFIANLSASVGPGFEIQLKTAEGVVVSQVAAGTYGLHVDDSASNHNFHLEGTGVNMATGIPDIQVVDWTVDFGDGYYTYHCDQHPSLTATFAAGNAQPLPAPAPAPAPVLIPVPSVAPSSSGSSKSIPVPAVVKVSAAATLNVSLTAKDKLTMTKGGKAVSTLETGTYKLVVSDKSAKRDVMLRKVNGGTRQLTGRSFTGTKTVNVELFGGVWKLYSAGSEKSIFSLFKVND